VLNDHDSSHLIAEIILMGAETGDGDVLPGLSSVVHLVGQRQVVLLR